MEIIKNDGCIKLYNGKKLIFIHSPEKPFINAIVWDLSYKASRGNFKISHKTKNAFPLDEAKVITDNDDQKIIEFFNSKAKIILTITENKNTVNFDLKSEGSFAYSFTFPSDKDEAFFGGGEQYRKLNLKGEKVINFVSEHIVVLPIIQKTIFRFFPYKEKDHKKIKTYAPMSTFVSSKKYALRFNTDKYGLADFTDECSSVFTYDKCPDSLIYAYGQSFEEIGRTLCEDTQNNEYLPDWAYDGFILGVQGGIDRVEQKVNEMVRAGVDVCGVWCQDWSGKKITAVGSQVYWNWSVDENLYCDFLNHNELLKKKGVHFLAYINPYLIKDGKIYNYCKDNGFLIKNKSGGIYHIKSTTFDAGMMDLTNPDMVEYLKEVIIKKNMLDLGIDGYMADFGEYLPVDCVLHNGDPKILHNEWPTLWAKINREAIDSHPRSKDIFFFTRSGYNGAQKYTTIMWNGDQHTDFSKDFGMACVIPATFNLGFSGLTAIHSDVGGYISFSSLVRDKQLYIKWMEMNTFSPLMRSHETVRPQKNAQPYDSDILPYTASLTAVHKALKPYLKECMKEAVCGIPIIRPDFYDSGDYNRHKDAYSYFLGKEIYVAPVIERDALVRKVYLPEGEWISFFDNIEYRGDLSYDITVELGKPIAFYKKEGKYNQLFAQIKLI